MYFVYLLLDGDHPFYVGCSKNDGRLAGHLYEAQNGVGGQQKNEIILQMLAAERVLKWQKIAEGLTYAEARKLESETILRRHLDGKPLANRLGRSETAVLRRRIAELEKGCALDQLSTCG